MHAGDPDIARRQLREIGPRIVAAGVRPARMCETLTYLETKFGPMMIARQLAEAAGRWDLLRSELASFYERDEPLEYLLTVGRKS